MRRVVFFSVWVLLWVGTLSIFAQPSKPGLGKDMMWLYRLNLTEEQQARIMDLRLKLQKDIVPLQADLKKLRSELHLALTQDPFNEGKVKKLVAAIAEKQQAIHLKRVLHKRQIRDVLTPEQRKQFDLRILAGPNGMGRHGKGKHHPEPPHRGKPCR
ncbi:MAG: Spy/CpxP family protein refolding chaperone [Calditrichaeota bacterium]|nr:Spy/CpxP family protein refolding chaperone [Calditrichota bacterium]